MARLIDKLKRIGGLDQSVISFYENPKKYIEEGTESAAKGGFLYRSESRLSEQGGGNSDFGFNFFGYSSKSNQSIQEQFEINNVLGNYFYPPLLNSLDLLLDDLQASLDLGGDLKKAKIEYSSIPKGMFDFSKASKGLIRPVEYYSAELNELVSPNDVYVEIVNENKVFLTKKGDQILVCEPRQEGTTAMLNAYPNKLRKTMLENLKIFIPETIDGVRVNKMGDKRLRFTSTEKKVFAYRKTLGGGLAPFVDLFINNSASWESTSEGRLLKAIPSLLIAKILQDAGVRTRIWAGEFGQYNNNLFVTPILAKEYGEPLDINKLSVLVSDSRFFRGLGSNAIAGNVYNTTKYWNNIDNRVKLNKSLNWGSTQPLDEESSNFVMKYVKNAFSKYEKIGKVKPSQAPKDLMIYMPSTFVGNEKFMEFYDSRGNLINIEDTDVEVINGEAVYKFNGDVVTPKPIESVLESIKESFYRGIDYISLVLSKNPKGVISSIRNRVVEDGIKKGFTVLQAERDADSYLGTKLTGDAFKNISYTDIVDNPNAMQGIYMSSKAEIESGKEKRLKLLAIINEQIKDPIYKSSLTI